MLLELGLCLGPSRKDCLVLPLLLHEVVDCGNIPVQRRPSLQIPAKGKHPATPVRLPAKDRRCLRPSGVARREAMPCGSAAETPWVT